MKPKFAFTVNTPDTRAKALAWSGDLETVCMKLRGMGYDGVELFVRDPRELDPEKFRQILGNTGLAVAAVGTGQVLAEDNLYFAHDDAAVRGEAVARVASAIDFAAELQSQVNIGKIRGDIQGSEKKAAWMDGAFRELEAHARSKGVMMTIEPQHRFGCDNLNTTRQALDWLRMMNLPNLKLMLDVFHMQIEDADTAASFVEAADMFIHVHFADTNRGAPGTGSIDFSQVLKILKALRYERFITMEIKQKTCFKN
jgi:sugar phosphate isomerase/epimerase